LQPRKAGSATCYELLGVDENCDFDTARDAYHRLVKMYHPDMYANAGMPPEITRYATEMFSQISAAYAEIRQRFNKAA
jgi:DnaJ-domain-containing protein 1